MKIQWTGAGVGLHRCSAMEVNSGVGGAVALAAGGGDGRLRWREGVLRVELVEFVGVCGERGVLAKLLCLHAPARARDLRRVAVEQRRRRDHVKTTWCIERSRRAEGKASGGPAAIENDVDGWRRR